MNISAVNNYNVTPQAFSGKPEDGSGGSGKAWASVVIPGLGQFLDGRNMAGTGFLGGSIATIVLRKSLSRDTDKTLNKELFEGLKKGNLDKFAKASEDWQKSSKASGVRWLMLAQAVLYVVSIIDAYRGDKHKK